MSHRRHVGTLLRSGVGVGIIVAIAFYAYRSRIDLAIIFSISIWNVILLAGLVVVYGLVSAAQLASLYHALDAPVGIIESFLLSTLGSFFALLLPQATYLTKAVYLKKRYNLPYSQTPVIFLGSAMVFIILGMAIVWLSLLLLSVNSEVAPGVLWFGIPLVLGIALLWRIEIPDRVLLRLGRVGNMLRLFLDGWISLRQNKRCLLQVSVYQLLMFIVAGIAFSAVFTSIGTNVSPLAGIVMSASTSFFNLVSLTPGNLGVQEAVVGYLAQVSGHAFVEGAVASMILRAVGLLVTLLVAPIAYYRLFWYRGIVLAKPDETDQ